VTFAATIVMLTAPVIHSIWNIIGITASVLAFTPKLIALLLLYPIALNILWGQVTLFITDGARHIDGWLILPTFVSVHLGNAGPSPFSFAVATNFSESLCCLSGRFHFMRY
jgi:hypothetical protein